MKNQLWSMSTTVRNPERLAPFLQTAAEIEGEPWSGTTQVKYQILLIKNRQYAPMADGLPADLVGLLGDYSHKLSYQEAERIFKAKNYESPPMRGRTSFSPLRKMGLASLEAGRDGLPHVKITELGRKLLSGELDFGEVVLAYLLKAQIPPVLPKNKKCGLKPFIAILHLIKRVNALCAESGLKPVGISKAELGIFGLSMRDSADIPATAAAIMKFRRDKKKRKDGQERFRFVQRFISEYLKDFKNPLDNSHEYADNILRYLRLTRYVYIRGNGRYIDLEPRRRVEIDSLLTHDKGAAKHFKSQEEYYRYIADFGAYIPPFENVVAQRGIAKGIQDEINGMERQLRLPLSAPAQPTTLKEWKELVADLRKRRADLANLLLKHAYQDTARIDEAINALKSLLDRKAAQALKPSIALEKWANVALSILDDARRIQPNCLMGDDHEPIFTAPAGVADIECYYGRFNSVCEVTMLTSRDQWVNEGQPVMRHLRDFEGGSDRPVNYCLFVAPRIHADTNNTFWFAVKYEFEGQRQRIIPLAIEGFVSVLEAVRDFKAKGHAFTQAHLQSLFEACIDVGGLKSSTEWAGHIRDAVGAWCASLE